jgi:D-hexose-6-phosphate mutarotase
MFTAESMFHPGTGGLLFARIENDLATATICLQGAQLTHWQPRSQTEPVTFLSAKAQYTEGKPIRAGIPICWPWFGPHATDTSLPQHGFARNLPWEARSPVRLENGATQLSLLLSNNAKTRELWPYRFSLEYRLTVGDVLDIELTTTNTDGEAFLLSEALHAYLQVGDIGAVQVLGLDGTEYIDKVDGEQRKCQGGPVTFAAEVDRVYVDTEARCTIVDRLLERRIHISKRGSRSTVVWSPGEKKAAALADLGAAPATRGGWRQFVCVECANAGDNTLTLAPGQSHSVAVRYHAESI